MHKTFKNILVKQDQTRGDIAMKSPISKVFTSGIALVAGCFLLCTETSSPEFTPPQITGSLMQPDGMNYASNACVTIRSKDYLPSPFNETGSNFFTCSTFTDQKGQYGFSGISSGDYILEGENGHGDCVLITDSLAVSDDTSQITLQPATLKPAGRIRGRVRLSDGGAYDNLFILIKDLCLFVAADDTGGFSIDNIPEGSYDLLIPATTYPNSYDTAGVVVAAGATTELRITLCIPPPPPESLNIAHDSIFQIVTLSWKKQRSRPGLRYNVFRSIEGEKDTLLTHDPLTDTFYRDDVALFVYKNAFYSVSSIDSCLLQSDTIYSEPIHLCSPWKKEETGAEGERGASNLYLHEIPGDSTHASIAYRVDGDSAGGSLLHIAGYDNGGNAYMYDVSDPAESGNRLWKIDYQTRSLMIDSCRRFDRFQCIQGIEDNIICMLSNCEAVFLDTSLRTVGNWSPGGDACIMRYGNTGFNIENDTVALTINAGGLRIVYLDRQFNEIGRLDVDSLMDSIVKELPGFSWDHSSDEPSVFPKENAVKMKYGLFVTAFDNNQPPGTDFSYYQTIYFLDGHNDTWYRIDVAEGDITFSKEHAGFTVTRKSGIAERYTLVTE